MRIFLDTEFTRFGDGRLISLGLVAQSGEEFYAELPTTGAGCSDFVRETVLPLLGREPHSRCTDDYELGLRLRAWLSMVKTREPLQVCFDFQQDWDLFSGVLGTVPAFCLPRLLDSAEIIDRLHHGYFRMTGQPEHHALHDARALHHAFRERIPAN
jgi:hypothetical protein